MLVSTMCLGIPSWSAPDHSDQNVTNCIPAPSDTVEGALGRTMRALARLGGSDDGRWWAYHGLTAQVQQMHAHTTRSLSRCLHLDHI